MFREVKVSVSIGEEVVFHFDPPLSIAVLMVTDAAERTLWEIIPADSEEVPVTEGSFQSWPIEEAPPELLAMLSQVQERYERELAERGPGHTPVEALTYGHVPAERRERTPAQPLAPGEYDILVFAEQGQGACRFRVDTPFTPARSRRAG